MDLYQISYVNATELVSSYYDFYTNKNYNFSDAQQLLPSINAAWFKQNILQNDPVFMARLKTSIYSIIPYGPTPQG